MKKFSAALACLAIGALISGCGGSAETSGTTTSQASATTSEGSSPAPAESKAESSTFKDGVLTTPEFKIEITSHKVIPVGEKGNEYGSKPVLGFWYKTTNLNGTDVDPMTAILSFTAYQDTNPNAENELNVAALPDDRFLDSQTEKIKKGGTVENAIAYALDDLTTPVVLVASTDLGFSEVGRVSYPLK